MSNEIGAKTKSGLYWNVITRILYELFRFGTSIIVARILDPKDFGIVSIATIVIFYTNTITNFGFNQALVQKKDITARHINSVFTLDLTISICMAGLFYTLAPTIASFFNSPESRDVIRVLSLIFILTTLYDLPYTLLRRDINFRIISIVDAAKEVSMAIITLALAMAGFKYWSLVIGQIVPLLAATLYLLYKTEWSPRISYDLEPLKDLFNFGTWSFIRGQLVFFINRVDRIIIGRFYTPSTLGLYDRAKSLSQMPNETIAQNINSVLLSSFSRAQHDDQGLRNLLVKGLVIISVLNFPIYLGLYVVAPHFIFVLFGEKWKATIDSLQILCLSGIFASFNGLFSTFIIGVGNYQKYSVHLIFLTCFLFIECLFLAPLGIAAVAAGVSLFSLLIFFVSFQHIKKRIQFTWREFAVCVLPAFFCSMIMLLTTKLSLVLFFEKVSLINLLAMVSIGACTYIALIVLIPVPNLNDIRTSIYRDLTAVWCRLKYTIRECEPKKRK